MLRLQFRDGCRVERSAAGEQLVDHEPQREDVAPGRDLTAEQLLRRHVGRRSRPNILDVSKSRETEVHDPDMAGVVEHHVRRFQIAMDDAALMRRREPCAELTRNIQGLVFREAADASERGREVFSVDILHGQVQKAAGLADVVHAAHVGMRDLSRRSYLVVKLREASGIAAEVLGQELQGHRLPEPEVVGPIHLAHPAAAEQADDSIPIVQDRARSKPAVVDGVRGREPPAR